MSIIWLGVSQTPKILLMWVPALNRDDIGLCEKLENAAYSNLEFATIMNVCYNKKRIRK